jgi:acyl-CoA thioesterase FadM
MHMILRFFFLLLRRRWRPKATFDEVTEITMRVLPIDLDFLWHVNNGVYFSYLDFGRMDAIFRNGVYDLSRRMGWYSVVAGETIKFKRSLQLWDKFTIKTQIIGNDEKCFFITQKFFSKNELMASALIKVRFLKRSGGTVSTAEVLSQFKEQLPNQTPDLSQEWLAIENKYLY